MNVMPLSRADRGVCVCLCVCAEREREPTALCGYYKLGYVIKESKLSNSRMCPRNFCALHLYNRYNIYTRAI